jgi:nucleoid DNA-binding protein
MRKDLVSAAAQAASITPAQADIALTAALVFLADELRETGKTQIREFGSWERKQRPATEKRLPTGEVRPVQGAVRVRFLASRGLIASIRAPGGEP